jgi:hypothetical protein
LAVKSCNREKSDEQIGGLGHGEGLQDNSRSRPQGPHRYFLDALQGKAAADILEKLLEGREESGQTLGFEGIPFRIKDHPLPVQEDQFYELLLLEKGTDVFT